MAVEMTRGSLSEFLAAFPDAKLAVEEINEMPGGELKQARLKVIVNWFNAWATLNTQWTISGDDAQRYLQQQVPKKL